MTDTETPLPEDAIWPVPDGSLLAENAKKGLGQATGGLELVEGAVMDLLDGAPVKADPTHEVLVHDLAWMVDHLEYVIDRAKSIQAEAATALAKAVPFGTPRIGFPGLRPLTPRYGGTRKEWANDLLLEHVRPRVLMSDPEAGEMRSPQEVFDVVLSVVSLNGSNAKVTGIRALGLDPDDYCKKTPAPPTIQVTKDALDR